MRLFPDGAYHGSKLRGYKPLTSIEVLGLEVESGQKRDVTILQSVSLIVNLIMSETLPIALYASILPKLAAVLEIARGPEDIVTPQAKQALLHAV